MKNIIPFKGNCFEFYQNIVNNKRKDKYKLLLLNQDIQKQFELYSEKFKINKLEEITSFNFNKENKSLLKNLYDSQNTCIKELMIELTTDKTNRINIFCQNCTIENINSFDHYLPKEKFAEFSVNPLNLIPSCSMCNSCKGKNSNRNFLNLYTDILPQEQYLFVDIKISEGVPKLKYSVENKNNINSEIYELIKSHYSKLHLFERFNNNSANIISDLEIDIKGYLHKITLNDIKNIIKENCEENKKKYGNNYWKIILTLTIIENEEFMKQFEINGGSNE